MINMKQTGVEVLNGIVKSTLTNMKAVDIKCHVKLVLDDSGSMEEEYEEGHVQTFADRGLALAMNLDADQKIDIYTLNKGYRGSMDNSSSQGWVRKNVSPYGGTPYAPVISDILNSSRDRSLADRFWEFFGRKTTEKLPTFVIFMTDGDCTDPEYTDPVIHELRGSDVFIQFIGLGERSFDYLKNMDRQNTGFFILPCEGGEVIDDGWFYQQLTKEFTAWYKSCSRN